MAINKNHKAHTDMMGAFESADRNTVRSKEGNASYGMGATGMPRTPAQQQSQKKATEASAQARKGQRASIGGPARTPSAPSAMAPGVSAGGLSLVKKNKGLLGL